MWQCVPQVQAPNAYPNVFTPVSFVILSVSMMLQQQCRIMGISGHGFDLVAGLWGDIAIIIEKDKL